MNLEVSKQIAQLNSKQDEIKVWELKVKEFGDQTHMDQAAYVKSEMEKTNTQMKDYLAKEQNQLDAAKKILLDKSINLKEELKSKEEQIKKIKNEALKNETDIHKQLAQRKEPKKTIN